MVGVAYVSTACTVHVAVEVMSNEGVGGLESGWLCPLGAESASGASSGRASASPSADMPMPVLVAQSCGVEGQYGCRRFGGVRVVNGACCRAAHAKGGETVVAATTGTTAGGWKGRVFYRGHCSHAS